MKKSLIALAVLAAAGAVSAQTATVSGTFGAAYQSYESAAVAEKAAVPGNAGTAAAAAATNKGLTMTDSSIKFSVVEDLGGGLKASAAVQVAANASRGGNVTKEDSSVGLSGGFGSLSINNTRSGNAAIAANVFASWMPVTSFYATVDSRAAIDTLAYASPELAPGLKLGFTYVEATEGAVTSAVKANVFSATYAAGPLFATIAYKDYNLSTVQDRTELAATYNLGVAKVGLGYGTKNTTTGKSLVSFGVSAPLGAATVGVNYAKRDTAKFYDAGVNYALSKRTTLGLMFGKLTTGKNDGNQYRVGVAHSF